MRRLLANIHGNFVLRVSGGAEIENLGAKARGVIAMLLLAENMRCSRSEAVALLWSDRGHSQGLASLRQVVSDIRSAFCQLENVFFADRNSIWLNPDRVEIDSAPVMSNWNSRLFHDLVIRDDAFKIWLSERRAEYLRKESHPRYFSSDENVDNSPILVCDEISGDNCLVSGLSRLVANSVAEWTPAKVLYNGRELDAEEGAAERPYLRFEDRLHDNAKTGFGSMALLWSTGRAVSLHTLNPGSPGFDEQRDRIRVINNATSRAIAELAQADVELKTSGVSSGAEAVLEIFGRRAHRDQHVRAYLLEQFDIDHRGIHLAWLAFLLTYSYGEREAKDRGEIREEAEALVSRALELEPHNSMVLALSSYVLSFLLGDYLLARDLAARSIALNKTNPLAWAFIGAANCYLGDYDTAYTQTNYARTIAGEGPYRYMIDTLAMIGATMVGRLESARVLSESVRMTVPDYKPPLRYLYAIHLKMDARDKAMDAKRRLKVLEPDFDDSLFFDPTYPVAALQKSGFLADIQRQYNWV